MHTPAIEALQLFENKLRHFKSPKSIKMKQTFTNGKAKRFTLVLSIVLAMVVTFASITSGNSRGNAFRLKAANANPDVNCNCSLLGGNKECLANNYGASCAPAGTANCSNYNPNCGGVVPPGGL